MPTTIKTLLHRLMLVFCMFASLAAWGSNNESGRMLAPPLWDIDPNNYQFRMDLVIRLSFENTPSDDAGNLIGAFVGNELRGVAAPIDVNGDSYYFLTVFSNIYDGEQVRFQAYYAPNDQVYGTVNTETFVNYAINGSIAAPYEINIDPTLDFPPEILPIDPDTTIQTVPFDPVVLANFLVSQDGDLVTWIAQAGPNLSASVVNGELLVNAVSAAWTGTDSITLIARENTPGQLSDTTVAYFTVLTDYGAPVLSSIPPQTIFGGGAFTPFDLDTYLTFNGPCRAFDLYAQPFSGSDPDPNWPAVAPAPQAMTIVARPFFVNQVLGDNNSELAAFVNGTLAAVATPAGVGSDATYTLELQNVASGPVTFQFYDASNQYVYTTGNLLSFSQGASQGSVASPYAIQFSPIVPVIFADGSVDVQIIDGTWRGALNVDFIAIDCDYPNYRRDSSATTFGIVDNNNPLITSASSIDFQENACYELYDMDAVDPNDSEGNGLTYSIEGGDDAGKFDLDQLSGKLSWLNFVPDYDNPGDDNGDNVYEVTLRVTNQLNLFDEIQLQVTVTEDADGPFNPQVSGGNGSCLSGGSALLTASGGATYLWNTGATTASITVSDASTYTVTITDAAACADTLSISLSVAPTIVASGNAGQVCQGSNVVLTSTPSGGSGNYTTFAWTGPNNFASGNQNPVPFPATAAAAGTYNVVVTDDGGCTATANVPIGVSQNSAPTIVSENNSPVCVGANVQLSSTPSGGSGSYTQYNWSGPGNFSSTLKNPLAFTATLAVAGQYVVAVIDDQGCSATDTTTVVVNPLPSIVATGNGPLCVGLNVNLGSTPSGGSGTYSTFEWSGPDNYSSNQEDPAAFVGAVANSGTYTVVVTDDAGCSASGSVDVIITEEPTITAMASGATCEGGSITLTSTPSGGTGNYTVFAWVGPNGFINDDEDPAPFPAVPAAAGTYSVTVSDDAGCTAEASTMINVYPAPSITAQSNSPVCEGANLALSSTPSGGSGTYTLFNWNGPDGYVASLQNPVSFSTTLFSDGIYTVQVTDDRGCTGTGDVDVVVVLTPVATASVNSPVCVNGTVNLTVQTTGGSGNFTGFAWAGPDGYSANVQSPPGFLAALALAGTYNVTITDDAGCTATSSAVLSVSSNMAPSITAGSNSPLCQGATLQLTSTPSGGSQPYVSFQWAGPNGYTANEQNPSGPGTTGTYTVTVTDNNGCSKQASTAVMISDLAANPSNIADCASPTITVSSAPSGGSDNYTNFAWTGPNNFSAFVQNPAPFATNPNAAGTYTLVVTDSDGCTSEGTTEVDLTDDIPPSITCPANTTASNVDQSTCTAQVSGIDAVASDACSPPVTLAYAFTGATSGSGNGQASGQTFQEGTTTVTYTATDDASNTNTCSFTVTVEPCTEFSGSILWERDGTSGVKDATVSVSGAGSGSADTDVNGDYAVFPGGNGGTYTLTPLKNINKFNGVSTADATRIQQHANNSLLLGAPFPRIAADVNQDNLINIFDAAILTQALLGSPGANNLWADSWRFVDADYTFPNPNQPWNFPESIDVVDPPGNVIDIDFLGVKLGDVTAPDADPAQRIQPLVLRTTDYDLKAGDQIEVLLAVEHYEDIAAFQFALQFDTDLLAFSSIDMPEQGLLKSNDFGTFEVTKGIIKSAYAKVSGTNLADGTVFFTVRFNVLQSGSRLSDALAINPEALYPEAYNTQLAPRPIELAFELSTGTSVDLQDLLSLKAQPNPTTGITLLRFELPQAGDIQLRLFDAAGRLVSDQSETLPAGIHLQQLELPTQGVYTAVLVTPYGTKTLRIIAAR